MQAYRVNTTVEDDGTVKLDGVPFPPGERVEVIALPAPAERPTGNPYPLRGLPYRYDRPTDPVAEEDWEALQ
jgi:hypothetical protein